MQSKKRVMFLIVLVLIGMTFVIPVRAEKKLGASSKDYTDVEVEPNTIFRGEFTVFNEGDEDFVAFAEVKSPPGPVAIRWKYPDGWETTFEMPIPAGELGYGSFSVFLGDLIQGHYYKWAIVIGYIEEHENDSGSHVVAHIGIPIHMIYPFPPVTSEPSNTTTTSETVVRPVSPPETTSIPTSSSEPDQTPILAIVAIAAMGIFAFYRQFTKRKKKDSD